MAAPVSADLVFAEYFDYDAILNNNDNIGNAPDWHAGTNNLRYRDSTQSGQLSFTGTGYVPNHAGGHLGSGNANTTGSRASQAARWSALRWDRCCCSATAKKSARR
jgi:hypothetical protein